MVVYLRFLTKDLMKLQKGITVEFRSPDRCLD